MINSSKNSIHWFVLIGLIFAVLPASFEVLQIPNAQVDWDRLFSVVGLLTITAYILLLIFGLLALIFLFLQLDDSESVRRTNHPSALDALGLSKPYRFIRCLVLSLFSMAGCINRSMVAVDICARLDSMDRYSDKSSSPAFQRLGRIYLCA